MAKYTSTYNKDTDYQALINDAVASKDYESAAVYEQQRNSKISGEGITDYQQTHDWEKYLPKQQTQIDNTPYIKSADNSYTKYTKQADQFDTLLNNLQNSMMNREAFSYNPETDPLYGVYKDLYTKNGQNAMNDTLAQISARTGGMASSYAGQAAQGAYNRYMDQLNAAVPELRNLAYQMYRDKIGDDEAMYGLLSGRQGRADSLGQNAWNNSYNERNMQADLAQQALENQWREKEWDYGVSQDALAQENWQKQFDYGVSQDALAQENWQKQFDYGVSQDALAQENWQKQFENQQTQQALENGWYEREWEYETGQDAMNRARDEIDAYLAAGGSSDNLPAELLQASGYSPAYIAAMENAYANTGFSGGGSYSGGSNKSDKNNGDNATDQSDQEMARKAVRNYLAAGGTISGIDSKLLERSGYTKQELLGILQTDADTASGNPMQRDKYTKLDYDQDEGTFRWNGKQYNSYSALQSAVNSSNLTDAEINELVRKLGIYGFDVE